MGFLCDPVGRITVEERRESFIVHPGYGYTEDGSQHDDTLGSFGTQWREHPHPEFLLDDLGDLIEALTALHEERERRG